MEAGQPGKGDGSPGKALAEAREGRQPGAEPIILAILQTQAQAWEPEKSVAIGKSARSAAMQARILLEGSKVLKGRLIDEKTKDSGTGPSPGPERKRMSGSWETWPQPGLP